MERRNHIIKLLLTLRKLFLKNKDSDIFTDAWFKNEVPRSKLFSFQMKPRFIKRLFFLYLDDNYWKNLDFYLNRGKTNPDPDKGWQFNSSDNRDVILQIIFLVAGLNLSDEYRRQHYKSLESIIYGVIDKIDNASAFGGWFDRDLMTSIDYTIKYSNKKPLIEQQNEEVINILKIAKLYIEAMSVIWKFNEIIDKDSDDIDAFAVNYFTLHGLHKIIGGKSQSIRNLVSRKVKGNKWKESQIDQINLHDFVLKQSNRDRTKTKIKALETQEITEYLGQEGYNISLDIERIPVFYDHGRRILNMHSTDKDTIKQIEIELQLRDHASGMKVLGASDYLQKQIAKLQTGDAQQMISSYKADDQIHNLLEVLNKYKEIITIDKEFLEVKNKIDRVGLNKFYKKSDGLFDNAKPFMHLYANHKAEFIKVISTINKIRELISSYDHLVILTESKNNLEIIKPLATISKYLLDENMKYKPLLNTLIVSHPINNLEQVKEVMELDEASKNSFQEDEIEKLKGSFDSVLYIDSDLFLEHLEDTNNHINFEDKDIKKFTDDEILNILNSLSFIKWCALLARFNELDIKTYKEFIKNMSRAGTVYISKRNQKQWTKGFIDERYYFQRRAFNQYRKRLIIVNADSDNFIDQADEEKYLKSLLNSKPGDEDKFIWLESDLSGKKFDYEISFIEI